MVIHKWKLQTTNSNYPEVPFYTPPPPSTSLKTSENHRISDVIRGYEKGTPGSNGLISHKQRRKLIKTKNEKVYRTTRNPANIYFYKVSNRNTRNRCGICSKLMTSFLFLIVNFKHILHVFLMFLLLDFSK